MNRRDFLRTLGRGASIAGVSPSTVGKMAMNLADSPSPKDNFIKNWIINHYQLLNGGSGSTVQDIEDIKNSYQAILTFLTNKGLNTDWVEDKIGRVEHWLDDDFIKNAISEYGGDIDDHFTNFIEAGIDGDADYEIYAILFKNNLIDEEMQNYLSKRGIDKQDHTTHEDEMKQLEQEEQKRKEDKRKQIAKDINYSRMDKAGSAEDEGYAKYYEKVNTFDSLLSFIKEENAIDQIPPNTQDEVIKMRKQNRSVWFIAQKLGLHRDVVNRILAKNRKRENRAAKRSSPKRKFRLNRNKQIIDPKREFRFNRNKQIIDLYKQGLNQIEIANKLKVSTPTVNIVLNTSPETKNDLDNRYDKIRESLDEVYYKIFDLINKGVSRDEAAKQLGISPNIVKNVFYLPRYKIYMATGKGHVERVNKYDRQKIQQLQQQGYRNIPEEDAMYLLSINK